MRFGFATADKRPNLGADGVEPNCNDYLVRRHVEYTAGQYAIKWIYEWAQSKINGQLTQIYHFEKRPMVIT